MADQFRAEAFTPQSEPLRSPLNYWARQVDAALQTIPIRHAVQINVNTASVLASTPVIPVSFPFRPLGVVAIKAYNVGRPGAVLPGALGISYIDKQPVDGRFMIEINAFYGLATSSNYVLTLEVSGG